MAQLVTETPPAQEGRRSSSRGMPWVVVAMQASVAVGTLVSGRAWGGITYMLAVLQAAAGIVLVAWLLERHRDAVLVTMLVPALSGALSAGLYVAGERLGNPTACTETLLASVAEVAPMPGEGHDFTGETPRGCTAGYLTDAAPAEVVAHYRAQLVGDGWLLRPASAPGTVAAERDRAVVRVTAQPDGDATRVRLVVADIRRYLRWSPPSG